MAEKNETVRQEIVDFTDLSACKPIKTYAFVFVCQKGKLEIGSLLLAASLKRFLKCEYELIAAIPTPTDLMGKPSDVTINLLEKMGVRITHIRNEIVSKDHCKKYHLITNKMYCLRIPITADKLIFVDSDILCRRDFFGDQRFSIPFNARMVAFGGTRHFEGKWYKFFEALNVRMPNIRMRVEGQEAINYVPPCFNSGFVSITTDLAPKLADYWFECWRTIEEKGLVAEYPYHIGQFALAVAISKMNIPYEILDRAWLYQYFFIYHKTTTIQESREMNTLVKELVKEYPEILTLVKAIPDWQFLGN